MHPIQRVLIVGGTHGNELTGIFLVKKFERSPQLLERSTFTSLTLLANPRAYGLGRRYVETDLNRCFKRQDLSDPTLTSYEALRAKEIDRTFGACGSQPVDFILDLHSTTAAMGQTLILPNTDPFSLQLAAYVSSLYPTVRLLCSSTPVQARSSVNSVSALGCTIEVGAIAQSTINADILQQTEVLIYAILDFLEAYNHGSIGAPSNKLTVYQVVSDLDFPRTEQGEISAMIHPQLQGQDYQPLEPGDPVFLTLDGGEIAYTGTSTLYPVFINEAAYYEKGIAFRLTQKQDFSVEADPQADLPTPPAPLTIRSAKPDDVTAIFTLIQALADYEDLTHQVAGSIEALRSHLFGDRPYAAAILAEIDGNPVGFALFFYNYSTFLTRPGIYLEDLFVLPDYRRYGIGTALLNHLKHRACAEGCGRLEWSVLDWNASAIAFYERMGADILPDWRICRITF